MEQEKGELKLWTKAFAKGFIWFWHRKKNLYENFAIWDGLLNNIGKKFEKDLRVIFDHLHSSWNSQPETQILKGF